MSGVDLVLLVAGVMLAVVLLSILAWLLYSAYLDRVERRLATRKGLYRELVSELATRDRALLEPTIHQMRTLYDLDALEAVLEEQARHATGRPAWLLEVYDQMGLVDKYIEKLRNSRKWRDRAFAAELLGRVGSAKAVPALLETVQATQTEDADVREIALRALARIADPHAVAPLVSALANADAWLAPRIADILSRHGDVVVDPLLALLGDSTHHAARAWAANVLGEVGSQRAFPALVRSLDDPDDEVRAKAATALGRLGDRRAAPPLLEHLLTDPAPFVRARIASTLAQFGGPEVIDRLVRSLGDPAWWVRMRAVEALEQIGSMAEGPLLVALNDPDSEIRQRAAVSLERLGVPASLLAQLESGHEGDAAFQTLAQLASAGTRELVAELLLHPSPPVRRAVISALRQVRRSDVGPELGQVARKDPEPELRRAAFDTLRAVRAKASLPVALAGVDDADPGVRIAAIQLAGEIGDSSVTDVLRSQTSDADREIRAAAVRALAQQGGQAADPAVMQLLGDPEPAVREAALDAVADAGLRSDVTAVIERLGDSDERVQVAAARALGVVADRSVVPELLEAFPGGTPSLKHQITLTLSRLDISSLTELIARLVESEDRGSRLAVARSLGRLRWRQGVEHLTRLAQDTESEVRAAAVEALGRCVRSSGPLNEDLIGTITGALHDPDEIVRRKAVDVCSRLCIDDHARRLIEMLENDSVPEVRERCAVAIGLMRAPGGESALIAACRGDQPANVRAAAALAAGAYDRNSLVTLVLDMRDESSIRDLLRDRMKADPWFRLLSRSLPRTSDLELRALAAPTSHRAQSSLSDGMRSVLGASERVRLIGGLRTFQGEQSRTTLLELVRADPSAEVRTAALGTVAELLDPDELLAFGSRALGDPSVMVRRAAVGLFAHVPANRAFPRLIRALREDEDAAVLTAVAGLADQYFTAFRETALAPTWETERAVLVTRLSRYIQHPDLPVVLATLSRSEAPQVREAVAEVWRHRPDATDPVSLEAITADPVLSVRSLAAGAAAAAARYELLDRMTQDPAPEVRRQIAVALGQTPIVAQAGLLVLEHLESDTEMPVRAAAHVARLLQGVPVPVPPDLDLRLAAEAVRAGAELGALRTVARTAASEDRRLAAGLALALIQDEVAREVARSDPAPSVRHRVAGALELSLPNLAEESA